MDGVYIDFDKEVYFGLLLLRTNILVELSLGLDIHMYHTQGEITYSNCLAGLTGHLLES